MLIGSGIAALISTILLAVMWNLDRTARPPGPGPDPGLAPPPGRSGLLIAVGLFTIAWVAVIAALCRDQIVRRINATAHHLQTAMFEFGEHRYSEGYLNALEAARPAPEPDDAGDPGGAEVFRFPRPPDRDKNA